MKRLLVTASLVFSAAFLFPCFAAVGDIDPDFIHSEISCGNPRIRAADSGAIFAVCYTSNQNPQQIDTGSTDIRIFKFAPGGQPDTAWGEGGVAKYAIGRLFQYDSSGQCAFGCDVPLRDGGFAFVLSGGTAIRYSNRGKLVDDFGSAQSFSLLPDDLPVNGLGWNFFGVEHAADGSFMALSGNYLSSDERTQSLALRRFDANAKFIEELRYRVDLIAFTDANGNTFYPGIYLLLQWAFNGGNLEIVFPKPLPANGLGLTSLSLRSGGGQTNLSVQLLAANPSVRFRNQSFYVLPDGKMIYASGTEIRRWNADGSVDSAFGVNGITPFLREHSGCFSTPDYPHLFVHTMGNLSAISSQIMPLRGRYCFTGYGLSAPASGGSGTSDTPLGPGSDKTYIVDRNGGVIYFEAVPNSANFSLKRVSGFGTRADVKVVEYYNTDLDHYFITAHEHEIDFVDKGLAGDTWQRTGNSFGAWNIETPMPGTDTVCRFYGDLKAGPNSHFYSAQAFECNILSSQEQATPIGQAAWRFERDAFRVTSPVNGNCPPNHFPVTRFYNGKSGARGEPNHRYVTRQSDIDAMTTRGWINEGVRMCGVF